MTEELQKMARTLSKLDPGKMNCRFELYEKMGGSDNVARTGIIKASRYVCVCVWGCEGGRKREKGS